MKRFQVVALLVMIALITAGAQAAFLVEAHSSGLANSNFSYNGTSAPAASVPSTAVGVTATNSVFGGNVNPDTYTYSYTPGTDADNRTTAHIPAGTDLGNGDLASGIVGGGTGLYNVYITWPPTTNANAAGCQITITNDSADVVLDPVNVNNGGTGTPGGNSGWYKIGSGISLTAGNTYTVTQMANSTAYVSMRSYGVMWEAVSEPPTVPDPMTLWVFADQWLDEGLPYPPEPGSADFNGDGRVDFKDFAILVNNGIRIDGSGEYRCIWVDIWGSSSSVTTASQCNALVQLCRDNNINTIIPEIRAYGDAYYQSNLEPRSSRIPNGGFDPLGYLVDKAHDTSGGKKYIEVHAWFVMQRISSSTTLDPQHVLSQHWEYVMRNSAGNTGTSYYLDPGHPGALDHNVDVILDCLSNYDIDGINLDYIRYPGSTWGYNQTSIDRFNAFYGKSGTPSSSDPDWADWRRECVTHQVKKVYVMSLMIDPDVVITADTINWGTYNGSNYTSSSAYAGVFQDWVGWLHEGIIDYNALMNYVPGGSNTRYNGWTDLSLANDDKRGSIIGIGAYMQTSVQDSMDQLLYARNQGAAGLNIYDWGGEVNANTIGETANDFYRELKAQVCPVWVDPPAHMWKVRPAKGMFEGYVSASGGAVDHAAVEIEGDPSTRVYADGSGWYAILEIPPGEYMLRFSKPGYADVVSAPTTLTAGQIKAVDVDL